MPAQDKYTIQIANQQDDVDIDDAFLVRVVDTALTEEGIVGATISVAIVDDDAIAVLNQQYLNHEGPTDVLSFLLECESAAGHEGIVEGASDASTTTDRLGFGKRIEGEIILSAQTALKTAAEYGWKPESELVLYLVHGLLHLCGYDDLAESDRHLMRRREVKVLSHWDLVPDYKRKP